jgi:hypothetical protein
MVSSWIFVVTWQRGLIVVRNVTFVVLLRSVKRNQCIVSWGEVATDMPLTWCIIL